MNIDLTLFRILNDFAGHSPLLDSAVIFLAAYSQYLWLAFLIVLCLRPSPHRSRYRIMMLLGSAAAIFARVGVKTVIVMAWARSRPYVVVAGAQKLIDTLPSEAYESFPSGHAIFFFALATVISTFDRRLGWWAYGAAALMGLSRVYVGVHWPSDILAGAALGVMTGWVFVRIWQWYTAHYGRE